MNRMNRDESNAVTVGSGYSSLPPQRSTLQIDAITSFWEGEAPAELRIAHSASSAGASTSRLRLPVFAFPYDYLPNATHYFELAAGPYMIYPATNEAYLVSFFYIHILEHETRN